MKGRFSWFNATSIALGFAFLYIPILLLVIYSFNEFEARDRVGRLVDEVVRLSARKPGPERCRMGDDPRGAHVSHNRDDPRHAGGDHARSPRSLPRTDAVLGHDLRAARHARRYHRAVAAAAVRRHRARPRLLDDHARAHHVHDVLTPPSSCRRGCRTSTSPSRKRQWISARRRSTPSSR